MASNQQLEGAELFVRSLIANGVDILPGYNGGAMLKAFDTLGRYRHSIRIMDTYHEGGAAFMGHGISRSSDKVGVVGTTSGPGATNIVTALEDALMDSIPFVAFTGQVPTLMLGTNAFQEADVIGITKAATKANFMITDARQIPEIVAEAFYIARSGRPGPVLVDFPRDKQFEKAEYEPPSKREDYRYENNLGEMGRVAQIIRNAKRPIFKIGGGVISGNASGELTDIVNYTGIPVTSTLMGLGAISGDHPLFLGMLGMHGTQYANYAVDLADVVISVASSFDDRVVGKADLWANNAKYIIHLNIDPSHNKLVRSIPGKRELITVQGDIKILLRELKRHLAPLELQQWHREIEHLNRTYSLKYEMDNDTEIPTQYIIEELWRQTRGEAIITTGVGKHQMWAAQYYKVMHPKHFLTSGRLATMGFGLPAANGAQSVHPDKLVIDIDGDGSFLQYPQELATAKRHGLKTKVALIVDGEHGMVTAWQEFLYDEHYVASELFTPTFSVDFVKLAESFGWQAEAVRNVRDVPDSIGRLVNYPDNYLIAFYTKRRVPVFPWIPSGGHIGRMMTSRADKWKIKALDDEALFRDLHERVYSKLPM